MYKKFILGVTIVGGVCLTLSSLPGTTISFQGAEDAPTPTTTIVTESVNTSLPSLAESTSPSPQEEQIPVETIEHVEEITVAVEQAEEIETIKKSKSDTASEIFDVPFFSQLNDITSAQWKKIGCGIASLAMIIEFHKPDTLTSVDTLLQEGIDAGAYLNNVGWAYAGLISVSKKYNLGGETHDFGGSSVDTAFDALEKAVARGPVMASVHYTFVPTNPIPHLVVVNGIKGDVLYYNDPAEPSGGGSISVTQFKSAWKKRYIEFYPIS